jgi:ubiquinone/menaquinone biosynthesis C-methylase UbiE
MGFYQNHIVPRLISSGMRHQQLASYRRRVVPAAEGRVLEIGIGSGLNLPFYSPAVQQVIGLDPSAKLLAIALDAAGAIPVDFIKGSAEAIPLE